MSQHIAIIADRLDARDPVTQTILDLAGALAQSGHRVSLLASGFFDLEIDPAVELHAHESVTRLRWLGIVRYRRWVARKLVEVNTDRTISTRSTLAADIVIPMRGLLRARIESDLQHSAGSVPRLIKRLAGLQLVELLPRRYEKQALTSDTLQAVIALSPKIESSLRNAGLQSSVTIQEAHIPLAPLQVDTARASATRDKLARAWGLEPGSYWVAYPFAQDGRQGLEPLLRAFKPFVEQGTDAVLLLAGPSRYTHLAWIAELGLRDRVRFVGSTARLDQLLPCSDLVVYLNHHDPVGWSVMAPLASGKPIITTTASDLAGAVERRGGTVLPNAFEPRALLGAIRAHHEAWQAGRAGGQTSPDRPANPDSPILVEVVEALLTG